MIYGKAKGARMGILDDVKQAVAAEEPAADEPAAPIGPLPEELVEEAADVLLAILKERLVKAVKEKRFEFDERQEGLLRKRTVRENYRYKAQVEAGFTVQRDSQIAPKPDRIFLGNFYRDNLCKSFNRYIGIAIGDQNVVAGFCRCTEHVEQVGDALLRKLQDGGADAEVKVGIEQVYNYSSETYCPVTSLRAASRIPCDSEGNI